VRGIVLFAHGSRDPEWARPFEAIRELVRRQRPECPIEVAYLERMKPTLAEAVATLVDEGASSIAVFPLFMAPGGHLKQDIPRLLEPIRASHPHIPIALEAALGEATEILEGIAGWIVRRAD
jgi:sirohydrochlorin cobaltochelatase